MSAGALIHTLRREGIDDERVLDAMGKVDRARFVPPHLRGAAWANRPLPIGGGQTISQPYIVALMSSLLKVESGIRVLEVGTGCGYQTAILVTLGAEVYTVERLEGLAQRAARTLERLGLEPTAARQGDGWLGWPEQAPFARILVTAAPPEIPTALLDQLAVRGRLVVPVGGGDAQSLQVVRRRADGTIQTRDVAPVRFVPLVGGNG